MKYLYSKLSDKYFNVNEIIVIFSLILNNDDTSVAGNILTDEEGVCSCGARLAVSPCFQSLC